MEHSEGCEHMRCFLTRLSLMDTMKTYISEEKYLCILEHYENSSDSIEEFIKTFPFWMVL